jgi:hypothetical protein
MSLTPTQEQKEFNDFLKDKLVLPKPDSIVTTIIEKFSQRAEFGKNKYGCDLDRTDLELVDYINHALEEHMDAILYLQKVKTMLEEKNS